MLNKQDVRGMGSEAERGLESAIKEVDHSIIAAKGDPAAATGAALEIALYV